MAATSATTDTVAAAAAGGGPAGPSARRRWTGALDGALTVGRRLAGAAVSLLAVSVTGFFLFRVIPGDPVRTMTRGQATSAAQIAQLTKEFGLGEPLPRQFLRYLGGLLHGDLGLSYQYRTPVSELIARHIGPTVLLVGTALAIAVALGLGLGTRAGWRPGGAGDRIGTGIALTLWSVPTFWLGLLLIVGLAVGVRGLPGLFPTGGLDSGDGATGWAHAGDVAYHMVLPVTTLVAVTYAQFLLVMRSSLLDERGADYLTTARAKGLRDDLVRRRHAVPNAILPTVTLIFVNLGEVVAGQILVETVFSWPGLGSLFYEALRVPDLPLLQGLFLFFAAAVILANLAADLVYPLLDPRVRAG
ncbi:ABC transporter permease [Phaeacidiphilus oryzae]|jgi:peptide/nickel transport system permease protein|uniref:ABC transporter permease n=1 Tax=Phaeacidiphilus oryzae TaxID=348818 RepID=UPI0009FEFD53|nr:ABC transporter permease [Phaeacidiphilus oryzae]